MPFRIGPWELIAVLLIVLIIFGAGKLPQTGKALGEAIKQFRGASKPEDDAKAKEPAAVKAATAEEKKA